MDFYLESEMNENDAYQPLYPLVSGLIDRQMLACLPIIEKHSEHLTEKHHLQYIAFLLGVIENYYAETLSILPNDLNFYDFLIYYEQESGGGLLFHWKEMITNDTFSRERLLGYESVKVITESKSMNPEDISKEYLIKALNI